MIVKPFRVLEDRVKVNAALGVARIRRVIVEARVTRRYCIRRCSFSAPRQRKALSRSMRRHKRRRFRILTIALAPRAVFHNAGALPGARYDGQQSDSLARVSACARKSALPLITA